MADQNALYCPTISAFFGSMGCATAIALTCMGSAYGTAKSSIGISSLGVLKPEAVMRGIIPVIMAGIVPIYGVIVAIVITNGLDPSFYPSANAFLDFGAGIASGLAGLASGLCIGIAGDAGVRAFAQQPRVYVTLILIMIFSEALGLYGLIVAIVMMSKKISGFKKTDCVRDF